MKRVGHLFEPIVSFDNLLAAAQAAYRGKRFRVAPAAFHFQLEPQLLRLQAELREGSYRPGEYRSFWIRDPKRRLISAAPYRDRVVQHAVYRIVEPIFDRTFSFDSYANRRGKGTHRALLRASRFAHESKYVLKCDVAKFFPSVDHALLLGLVRRKLKCRRTLDLIEQIVDHSNPQEPVEHYFPGDDLFSSWERRRGLRIGNLLSQFLANVMLDPLDRFVQQVVRPSGYVRFADDFLLFGNDKGPLTETLPRLQRLLDAYRLRLHPRKSVVLRTACGVPFLGWRLYGTHRRLLRPSGVRIQRGLRRLAEAYRIGQITLPDIKSSLAAWAGHLKWGRTAGLHARLLSQTVFRRQVESTTT